MLKKKEEEVLPKKTKATHLHRKGRTKAWEVAMDWVLMGVLSTGAQWWSQIITLFKVKVVVLFNSNSKMRY
jgi:hypothetical protein